MYKRDSIRLENPSDRAEIVIKSTAAHMLEHAHRNDTVILAFLLPVVAEFKGDLFGQAGLRCAGAGGHDLFGRQAQTGHAGLMLLGKLQRQAPPARADIENVKAGPQQQLCSDVSFLEGLRLVQSFIACGEVGA